MSSQNPDDQLQNLLKKISVIREKGCVTLVLGPNSCTNNLDDQRTIQKLVDIAKTNLDGCCEPSTSEMVCSNLNMFLSVTDHKARSGTLLVFANSKMIEAAVLPFKLENRVIVAQNFTLRQLLYGIQMQYEYYVLLISRQNARILKARNHLFEYEVKAEHSLAEGFVPSNGFDPSEFQHEDQSIEQFFYQLDRDVSELIPDQNSPIVLITDQEDHSQFLRISEHKNRFIACSVNKIQNDKPCTVIQNVWNLISPKLKIENNKKALELSNKYKKTNFITDLNEIYSAVLQGLGNILLVQENYYQRAILLDKEVFRISEFHNSLSNHNREDIVGDIINEHYYNRGKVVFFEESQINNKKMILISENP